MASLKGAKAKPPYAQDGLGITGDLPQHLRELTDGVGAEADTEVGHGVFEALRQRGRVGGRLSDFGRQASC
jgi:hypothetical protein